MVSFVNVIVFEKTTDLDTSSVGNPLDVTIRETLAQNGWRVVPVPSLAGGARGLPQRQCRDYTSARSAKVSSSLG